MNGLLLVDKPSGITSFEVVRSVRRLCGTRRVGHCGTLDPLASGVLPVAIGTTTRLVEFLMGSTKVYLASLQLGAVTDTQDVEGRVLATAPWEQVDRDSFEQGCRALTGVIRQLPPMYSALKRDGMPLYRLARQGIEVEREPREVTVETIELLRFEPPSATLRVTCGKGTYIRTLCHDLGQLLGCGAFLTALRRTACGSFTEARALPLAVIGELAAGGGRLPLLSNAEALDGWPAVTVRADALARLANGVAPLSTEVDSIAGCAPGEPVRLLAGENLAAVARFMPSRTDGRRGDFILDKVFPEVIFPS